MLQQYSVITTIVVLQIMNVGTAYILIFLFYCCVLIIECKSCHHRISVDANNVLSFNDSQLTGDKNRLDYCTIEISSPRHHLVNIDLTYQPHEEQVNCTLDYLHVGNDGGSIDEELMTSYKFCEKLHRENIVSRDNYLWVVLRSSKFFPVFHMHVEAKRKVECNKDEFQCSPIQCVSLNVTCDGVPDCHNHRDEYCPKTFIDNSCFHCFDGTCIRPTLPRYDDNWGKEMWYLCDEFKHCPDGTDERKDICYRVKSRVASMIRCIPNDVPSNVNTSVLMWNTVKCDKRFDCLDHSDETNDDCQPPKEEAFIITPASFVLVVCSVVLVIAGSISALKYYEKQLKEQNNFFRRPNEGEHSYNRGQHIESSPLTAGPFPTIEEEIERIEEDNDDDVFISVTQPSTSSSCHPHFEGETVPLQSDLTGHLHIFKDTPEQIADHVHNEVNDEEVFSDGDYVDKNGIRHTHL